MVAHIINGSSPIWHIQTQQSHLGLNSEPKHLEILCSCFPCLHLISGTDNWVLCSLMQLDPRNNPTVILTIPLHRHDTRTLCSTISEMIHTIIVSKPEHSWSSQPVPTGDETQTSSRYEIVVFLSHIRLYLVWAIRASILSGVDYHYKDSIKSYISACT